MAPDYKVYILNPQRERVARLQNLAVMDQQKNILQYGKQLSGLGFCRFRLGMDDPIWNQYGNIVYPHKYMVQVMRGKTVAWEGIIVDNPHRKRNYIDVEAKGYLYRFTRVLVKRDPETKPGDGLDNYRTFKTGTMANAINAMFNETKDAVTSTDIVKQFTLGLVENPNYPSYFTTAAGVALGGAWNFSSDITLQFDYKDVFYVMHSMGVYANCDMELTDDLVFNFRTYIGQRREGLVFEYKRNGAIIDFDAPLRGSRTVNDLMGIAADLQGNVLHLPQRDEASVAELGLLQGVEGYLDIKEKNALRTRLNEEMRFRARPDSVINMILSEKAYPFGQWGLGDTVTVKIKRGTVDVDQARRITAYGVKVHNTGKEVITLETNPEKAGQ